MTWYNLENSTTTDQQKVNADFRHVRAGSIYPRGGDNLAETTSVYNLGSDSARWNNAYINTIYASTYSSTITATQPGHWQLMGEIFVTQNSDYVDFTGLDATRDKQYIIIIYSMQPTAGSRGCMRLSFDNTISISANVPSLGVYGFAEEVLITPSFISGVLSNTIGSYYACLGLENDIYPPKILSKLNIHCNIGNSERAYAINIMASGHYMQTLTGYPVLTRICGRGMSALDYKSTLTTMRFFRIEYTSGAANQVIANTYIGIWRRG